MLRQLTMQMKIKLSREGGGGGGGEDSHMKRARMLVVSLSGVNFRFWSLLGCSGQTAPLYLAIEITFRVALEEIYIFNSFYLLDSCTQSLK